MKLFGWCLYALAALGFAASARGQSVTSLYVQSGTDPTWQQLLDANAIPVGQTSTAGVTGSTINVVNNLVEVGPNANNPIPGGLRIHTLGNSSVQSGDFNKWSRWYQQDGNTQVFRLFEGEENVRNDRGNAARIEAFAPNVQWAEGDGWHKFQATYTIIHPGNGSIFQAKNNINDWSVMINMNANGTVLMNRRVGEDVPLATNMIGVPFDLTVYDNGLDYQVFFNDVFQGSGQFSRPEGTSQFRWGMYVGDNPVNQDQMLFVTGAKITAGAAPPGPTPLPGVVLAGWTTWASGSEAASVTGLGAAGLATESGDWRESNEAASNDGTFGSLVGGASASTSGASSGTYIGITGDGAYSFTVTAGDDALSLASFHFDAQRKRSNAPENWTLEATAGAITLGTIASGTLGDVLGGPGPANHDDMDISLAQLTDNVLEAGQSATFRLSFTGGNPTNTDQRTYLDNVAITGNLLNPPTVPGDTDGDGDIDDSDLGTAFSNYTGPGGTGKSAAQGDTDGDGDVDDGDLGVAFSGYTGPTAPSVPEPGALAALLIGAGVLATRRCRA